MMSQFVRCRNMFVDIASALTLCLSVIHCTNAGSDWSSHHCVTIAQIHTGHSPLMASYLQTVVAAAAEIVVLLLKLMTS